jgi:ubiquinone/menaquinone biosynthesis C-methylase UbiE
MTNTQPNDALRQWHETAPYWTRHSDTIREMFAPVTEALIRGARITEGRSVLDVAGGAGEPSLTIAERVGPAGSVTCTDAVAEMVEAARAEAAARGITNVQFRQCTAESLPFADESFDVVVSRLGAMFFPDPLAACKEMLRVMKPGGTVSFVVWHKSELNPFCHIVSDVMSRHVPSPPAGPDAPGAFRFAELGKLASILKQAGATDVTDHVLQFQMQAPLSAEQFWNLRSETSETLRTKLATLSESTKREVGREVVAAVRPFFPNDQLSFPTQLIIVTGNKALT